MTPRRPFTLPFWFAFRYRFAFRYPLSFALALPFAFAGCASAPPRRSTISVVSPSAPSGPTYEGKASWYGREQHGGPTASGEKFNMNALTAAHRTLRLNTRVRVINLRNGREVVVRINDRGPYSRGRIIDVSFAAARALGMIEAGVVPVRIEVLP
jgi:rare lipoprotein A